MEPVFSGCAISSSLDGGNSSMKNAYIAVLVLVAFVHCLSAQEGPLVTDPPKGSTPEQVIEKFTAKEKDFKNARKTCTYRQAVRFQTMDGTQSTSEYRQVADVKIDSNGNKVKSIVLSPQASMTLSPEDEMDIESRLHWTLSTDELPEYKVTYKGQQQEDDLHAYVFDVEPKEIKEKQRYFQGTIWIDDHDFQIVKMTGKAVPDIVPKKKKQQPNLFPKFTTWRELINGRYWFPTYSLTDDTLHFPTADVHLVGTVKATNIKCAGW
jgi:outer membrane lipoprotein-sorting protein